MTRDRRTDLLYGWNFNSWFYLKKQKVCICAPQKNGCTSLFRSLHPKSKSNLDFRKFTFVNNMGPFTPQEINELFPTKKKFLMVRSPVDRFSSLWRDKALNKTSQSCDEIEGFTPAELIQHIMNFPLANYHWYPQYMYMVPGAKPIPFYDVFKLLGIKTKHENSSGEKENDPEMPVDLILQHYHQDALLWERALENSVEDVESEHDE